MLTPGAQVERGAGVYPTRQQPQGHKKQFTSNIAELPDKKRRAGRGAPSGSRF